eukprot:7642557-Alexandrium_andersonii.AAC.1
MPFGLSGLRNRDLALPSRAPDFVKQSSMLVNGSGCHVLHSCLHDQSGQPGLLQFWCWGCAVLQTCVGQKLLIRY